VSRYSGSSRDSVPKIRICNECRETIVGVTTYGLVVWLDAVPLSLEAEALFHKAGRATYKVKPMPMGRVFADWRGGVTAGRPLDSGFLLVEHAHQRPSLSTVKVEPPAWLIRDHTVSRAPVDPDEILF
jgi:hypothetical protein